MTLPSVAPSVSESYLDKYVPYLKLIINIIIFLQKWIATTDGFVFLRSTCTGHSPVQWWNWWNLHESPDRANRCAGHMWIRSDQNLRFFAEESRILRRIYLIQCTIYGQRRMWTTRVTIRHINNIHNITIAKCQWSGCGDQYFLWSTFWEEASWSYNHYYYFWFWIMFKQSCEKKANNRDCWNS